MSRESSPHYPRQGEFVAATAAGDLLPAGLDPARARILFVHAHPDDESTVTGATMGFYAERGAQVQLLTFTRGEMGEVIPAHLRHLEADRKGDGGLALGELRALELEAAITELGVNRHLFLGQQPATVTGAADRYRDSGMAWGADGRAIAAPQAAGDCLTATDSEIQARSVARLLWHWQPQVVVTYDRGGGYGHPDHVRTHRVTLRAVQLVAGGKERPPLDVEAPPKPYRPSLLWGLEGDIDREDTRQQAVIDGSLSRKRAAMAAHRTQVVITSDSTYQFSNRVTQKISARETYRLLWADERENGTVHGQGRKNP